MTAELTVHEISFIGKIVEGGKFSEQEIGESLRQKGYVELRDGFYALTKNGQDIVNLILAETPEYVM
ncbi:MAG: hypothetical protein HY514_02855 [Candidatus Aenigmarchaeota archaeon]|nr:hypothetical protein [Candidatus Aenigmarchaeota archaeon]